MRNRLIVTAALVLVWAVVVCHMPSGESLPDPRVEQLQAEVQRLRADLEEADRDLRTEMEDVRNVQGYIVWEKDWRNEKEAP